MTAIEVGDTLASVDTTSRRGAFQLATRGPSGLTFGQRNHKDDR